MSKTTENKHTITDDFIGRLKSGDEKAYEDLYKEFRPKLYSAVYNILGNKEDTEEILLDTFVKVYRKIYTFEGRSSLSSWIYAIALNLAKNRYRHRKIRGYFSSFSLTPQETDTYKGEFDLPDESPSPLQKATNVETKERVMAALENIPLSYKKFFVLRDIEDLSYEEIAQITHTSLNTVKTRIHRARLKVRNELEKEGYEL